MIKLCIIIGSGPAGYTAAIYSSRSDLNPILYTGDNIGGQLMITNNVYNYPGFKNGIFGPKLMDNFKKQAKKFGTKIIYKKVIDIIFENKIKGIHKIILEDNSYIFTYGIIIATGSKFNKLNINNEKKFLGKGISTCSICDGNFYKNQNVAIVGGGDTAVNDALYLSKICKKIYIIIRKNKFKATKIMQKYLKNIKNIKILFNNVVYNINGNKKLTDINILNLFNNKIKNLKISGLFLAIGSSPNTKIFKNKLLLDKYGYIITKKYNTETNIYGVFAAGDVQDKLYKQVITASSTGCMSAIDLENYLNICNLI